MDREILFRAKELHKDEWVYGVPVNFTRNTFETDEWMMVTECNVDELDYCIPDFSRSLIKPETICQYTGLLDKNCQKVFEGDILLQKPTENFKEINLGDWECYGLVEYGEHDFRPDWHGYCSVGFSIKPIKSISLEPKNRIISKIQRGLNQYDLVSDDYPLEVIGNIFDNPELLEVQK